MGFDIKFSRPSQSGKCTATLFESDEQGQPIAGRAWTAPFNSANIDDAEKLASLHTELFAKVKADDGAIAEVNILKDKAVEAKVTIKPVEEVTP